MTGTGQDAAKLASDTAALEPQRHEALLQELRERAINIEGKIDQLIRSDPSISPNNTTGHPDQAFGGRTYAQAGEDLIVLNLFHRLGIERPHYLDVGAHHPFNVSNTALLYFRGSRGINVEANPNLIGNFLKARPEDITINAGVGPEAGVLDFYMIDNESGRNSFDRQTVEDFVRNNPAFKVTEVRQIEVMTLTDIISRYADARYPEFLSLDVEGWDRRILETTSFADRGPLVICVESLSGNEADDSDALEATMTRQGYRLYHRTIGNLIFTSPEVTQRLGGRL
ncbi:FkbM family methyltransferase [Acidisphaera rubrifaciens]|uniref:Methyltransferase FkbM n=1 Tax=Acidisphaera rubrifaciens HS-AP3 TaxID=1231350 RepID=A0A0D6P3Y5_9PROT|nr:FkbM family methyltransferase [Acidisphaera rubrifaciens]GAN75903.1 methyltransferase FkbM [Acidisphaera rubrifaciens HS-AP3]